MYDHVNVLIEHWVKHESEHGRFVATNNVSLSEDYYYKVVQTMDVEKAWLEVARARVACTGDLNHEVESMTKQIREMNVIVKTVTSERDKLRVKRDAYWTDGNTCRTERDVAQARITSSMAAMQSRAKRKIGLLGHFISRMKFERKLVNLSHPEFEKEIVLVSMKQWKDW